MLQRLRRLGLRQASLIDRRAATHLHVMASSVGYEKRSEGYDWHGLRRGSTAFGLLQYSLGGAGRLRIDGRVHEILPGQAMLLRIPHDHRYWLPEGGQWELCYIIISGSEALRLWAEIVRDLGPVLDCAAHAPVQRAIEEVVVSGLRDERQAYQVSATVYELLMLLLALRDRQRFEIELPLALRAAMEFGEGHYADAIGVDELAAEAGLSRYHFSRQFRQQVGDSPGAWLQALRVRKAAEALIASDASLAEIARSCGFADANYFGKVFRKTYGVSPGAFRRMGV